MAQGLRFSLFRMQDMLGVSSAMVSYLQHMLFYVRAVYADGAMHPVNPCYEGRRDRLGRRIRLNKSVKWSAQCVKNTNCEISLRYMCEVKTLFAFALYFHSGKTMIMMSIEFR